MAFNKLLLDSSEILLSEFKFKPVHSSFSFLNAADWHEFVQHQKINIAAQGVYFPRKLSAYLNGDSKFAEVNLLHEYFGHGLFCEYARDGKSLVSLERTLEEIEKSILGTSDYEKAKISVDDSIPTVKEYVAARKNLQSFFYDNLPKYEGFAIWLENFLSKRNNLESLFFEKMDRLVHPDYRRIFEEFLDFSNNFGNFALISNLGFPKYYGKEVISDMLERLYKSEYGSIRFAVLYGSKKPLSDVDLFLVSDSVKSTRNNWLDVFCLSNKEFEIETKILSIAVTDPLFSGELIKGDSADFEKLKREILNQEITKEAIHYNSLSALEQDKISFRYSEGSIEREIAEKYVRSFSLNAQKLKEGRKLLTYAAIVSS